MTIGGYFATRLQTLRQLLQDIADADAVRRNLSGHLLTDLDAAYLHIKDELLPLQTLQLRSNPVLDHRRATLERRLDSILHERHRQQVDAWRDGARLATEARSWWKQHEDLRQRLAFVNTEDASLLGPYSGGAR